MSQQVLAHKIGMSYRTLQRSLKGQRSFEYEEMVAISLLFGDPDLEMYREAS